AKDVDLDVFTCPRGQRPFEQLCGRQSLIRAGGRAVPLTEAEIPAHGELAPALAKVWARRRDEIGSNPDVALIEKAEFKRLWRDTDQNVRERDFRAESDGELLRSWLLDRLEAPGLWPQPKLHSAAHLADRVRSDAEFQHVAALYRGRPDFDLT